MVDAFFLSILYFTLLNSDLGLGRFAGKTPGKKSTKSIISQKLRIAQKKSFKQNIEQQINSIPPYKFRHF